MLHRSLLFSRLKLEIHLFSLLILLVPNHVFAVEATTPRNVPPPQEPKIAPASSEGEQALATFKLPEGFRAELYAAEPHVAHPVAICFDRHERCYVGETFRQDQNRGVEDNRNHMDWLDEDLAAQTVADRRAYLIRHRGDQIVGYTKNDDRIRRLEDRDGDGKIDHASVFASGFNDIDEGTGAGLLSLNGSIYYTCIPRLWKLTDKDDDGVADERVALHDGFGVRTAFRGHDMHGLILGPDGRIYFSMGDRGLNVQTKEGPVENIETGAVLRCEPDGSNLEIFATGLRNPQELAFDAYGNLFTVDNNSDSGDQARLVHVVDGGDSGWRMAYQYLADRGPWNREKLWHPEHEGQPAYIVPPIINMANGPSGLVYYPGTGMPEKYNGHFFLCEYRGGATNSGVMSFAVEPNGAGFKQIDEQQFFWSILPSDVEFGPSGELFVTDWVHGWLGQDKGRIYKVFQPEALATKENKEAAELLTGDFSKLSSEKLVELMGHANMRVRLQAQFALVDSVRNSRVQLSTGLPPEYKPLAKAIGSKSNQCRLHAVWGLGQLGRVNDSVATAILWMHLHEQESQVKSQIVRMLGEAKWSSDTDKLKSKVVERLIPFLAHDAAPVRFQTAIALGKLKAAEAVEPLVAMIEANNNEDVMLRHAGVMGLTGTATVEQLVALADHASPAVRLAAVLALRRKAAPEIARYLTDSDPFVVEETARAIYDLPITEALPSLADRISQPQFSHDELAKRMLYANFRLGSEANANAVAKFATRATIAEPLRMEAVHLLADWSLPSAKDRLLNIWRPLPTRPASIGTEALRSALPGLLTSSDAIRAAAAETAAALGLREVGPELLKLFEDKSRPAAARVAAFQALLNLSKENAMALDALVSRALADDAPTVRAAALRKMAAVSPAAAFKLYETAVAQPSLPERQAALTALSELDENEVAPDKIDEFLAGWLDKLIAGDVPPEIQLDLITAAEARTAESIKAQLAAYRAALPQDDPLLAFRPALAGGDALRGEAIFFERSQLSCIRCHTVRDKGGLVGPELTKIGSEKNREYLLEAIVDPNKTIAKGFQSETVLLDDGRVIGGVFKDEDDTTLRLMTPDGRLVTIDKRAIDERQSAKSPMPEDFAKNTTLADLRDLVEFLSSLQAKP